VTWEFEPGFAFKKPSDIVGIVEVGEKNFGCSLTPATGTVAVEGARQDGKKETLKGGGWNWPKSCGARSTTST
jgi:hypothetical protein